MSIRILFALILLAFPLRAQTAVQVGERVPDFSFEQVVMNGDGFFRGEDFLGGPVLYEFWGFR